jgi:hypothetical protein
VKGAINRYWKGNDVVGSTKKGRFGLSRYIGRGTRTPVGNTPIGFFVYLQRLVVGLAGCDISYSISLAILYSWKKIVDALARYRVQVEVHGRLTNQR